MASYALTGEMKTKITIKGKTETQGPGGYPRETWSDLFGEKVWCKWVNAYGQELFEGLRLDLKEAATITMRYSDKVNPKCEIYREDDSKPYEVISVNDILDKHQFLEIKVKRKVKA